MADIRWHNIPMVSGMPGKTPSPTLQHEIGKKRPFDLAEQEAHLNVLRTAACLARNFERLFRAHGLSEATYNALRIIRGHCAGAKPDEKSGEGGVPSQTIGKQLIAEVPDVTRLIDRLVASEPPLVERSRVEHDRRVVMVRITKAGLDVLARLDKSVRELHVRQLGHMSRRELEQLSELLVKARAFRSSLPEAAGRGER